MDWLNCTNGLAKLALFPRQTHFQVLGLRLRLKGERASSKKVVSILRVLLLRLSY